MALSNVNKWYGKWNILFDKWDATPYEVNVACKENDGQLSYHASFEKGKLSSQTTTDSESIMVTGLGYPRNQKSRNRKYGVVQKYGVKCPKNYVEEIFCT